MIITFQSGLQEADTEAHRQEAGELRENRAVCVCTCAHVPSRNRQQTQRKI